MRERKLFPTRTARNGRTRPNSINDGSGQGRGSPHRWVHCAICGHVFDKTAVDHSGGDLTGNGAGGIITKSDNVGQQAYRKNAGCPLCFTKNGVRD